ncbi:hypothetical protein CEXT_61181 [Caerostris extrusa]|uniref:Uncharacterized protein n=1 Tax=Caerostris extrusa TaxID=172846 RepID=A0AAV4SFX0_CAEEX|nr:hypothetical protein CEXT_61181 [Caerostris extrusa]
MRNVFNSNIDIFPIHFSVKRQTIKVLFITWDTSFGIFTRKRNHQKSFELVNFPLIVFLPTLRGVFFVFASVSRDFLVVYLSYTNLVSLSPQMSHRSFWDVSTVPPSDRFIFRL